jgi:hypothetical protein
MKRKRDNWRYMTLPKDSYGPIAEIKNAAGNVCASIHHTMASNPTDPLAFTVITIRLRGGKSYELTIRPRGVELKENKHGN